MTANSTDEQTIAKTATPNKKKMTARQQWIVFALVAVIIAAVIAIPAMIAGASPTVAILLGLVGGIIGSIGGKLLSGLNI